MLTNDKKLDNPVWYSLSETHREFSVEYHDIKFYHPDYCPFGGSLQNINVAASIAGYAKLTDNFFVVGEKPAFHESVKLRNELVCNQMIIEQRPAIAINENIAELDDKDRDKLLQLVNLVQPGYFKSKTSLLGSYYGIFKDGKLVAVTGERMKMNEYTEVSAVVTHPGHTGKGYAGQLVSHTVNCIFDQNKIPYLHVAETNTVAVRLYEKLGFKTRRKISFWNLVK
jgi:ribosomal protein S18 acetylase RimI-like enzyme